MRKLFLLVGLVLAAGQAQGDDDVHVYLTGSKLSQLCSSPLASTAFYECHGYVAGAHDVSKEILLHLYGERAAYCIPNSIGTLQLALVVKKYLEEHPENLHKNAGGLIVNAFHEAFPCK